MAQLRAEHLQQADVNLTGFATDALDDRESARDALRARLAELGIDLGSEPSALAEILDAIQNTHGEGGISGLMNAMAALRDYMLIAEAARIARDQDDSLADED